MHCTPGHRHALLLVSCFLAFLLAPLIPARAEVRVAGVFGDHMVLQCGVKLPVWGWADAGEAISVRVGGKGATTKAGADGNWRVDLDPFTASSNEPVELTISGSNTITIHDVLIGEVWLASGQSNMEYSLKGAHDAAEEMPKADHPQIRLARIGSGPSLDPLDDRKVTWVVCTPETAAHFSAVAYYFARDLQQSMNAPVGVIGSYVSGTPAQSWTPLEALQSSPVLSRYVEAVDRARHAASTQPSTKRAGGNLSAGVPTSLYNGMIAPLMPFAIKGVIWYQGESNVSEQAQYRTLFPAMISGWRSRWGEGDFPFLFVQLPGFGRRGEPDKGDWALMREAQTSALALPNTAMAVTLDLVPKRALLHPKNKSGVAARLALAARGMAYGEKITYRSPTFDSLHIEGHTARVTFKDASDGLIILSPPEENLQPPTDSPRSITGFEIAGEDRTFHPAQATIDGSSIVLQSDDGSAPVAVRYGWANNPEVNVYGKSGLPVAPFRTDDWPVAPTTQKLESK